MIDLIKLNLSNKELFFYKEYPSILKALENNKISIAYQCLEGYCGLCRCRLISGKVNWIIQPVASISKYEILLCCCQTNGNIIIEI